MNLATQLTTVDRDHHLPFSERAALACHLAKQFEKSGDYEAACQALIEFWPDRQKPPKVDGLAEPTKAAVLLRVGALVGWAGSADQSKGSQEAAKNLAGFMI